MKRALRTLPPPKRTVNVCDTMWIPAHAINPTELLGAEIPIYSFRGNVRFRVTAIEYDEDDQEKQPGYASITLKRIE